MEQQSQKNISFYSLPWALPYLLFMFPFIYNLWQQPLGWQVVIIWLLLVAFIGIYVLSWIIFPPCSRYLDGRLIVIIVTMMVLDFLLAILSGAGQTCYFLVYVSSVIIILAPTKQIPTFMGIVLFELVSIIYLLPFPDLASIVIIMSVCTFVCFLTRRALQDTMDRALKSAEIEYRSAEAERNRVSAQLHDTLGQTLTAINLYAQLTIREIKGGYTEQASLSAKTVSELASDALTQVRQVVKENYTLCFKTELENSLALLNVVNIKLSTYNLAELPIDLENLAAWILREGTTNIIHHSTASHAYLVANKRGIALINDGGAMPDSGSYSGNGIKGLRTRCDESMRLTCGKLNAELWHSWMGSVSPPKHGPGFIMQLTFKE